VDAARGGREPAQVIELGVIGCGWLAEAVHLPVLGRLEGVRVRAACDARAERLTLAGRRFGIPALHAEAADLLADPALDAVLIATTAETHVPLALAALAARKHVLVEKPRALVVDEGERLVAAARAAGVVHMVGLNYRFHPLVLALKRVIERGAIGRPVAALCTMLSAPGQKVSVSGYEADPARGGGVLHDKAVHLVDVLRFLFEREVVRCRALAGAGGHAPHASATFALELAGGLPVAGHLSDHAAPDCSFVVMGEEGHAAINLARPAGVALYTRAFSRSRAAKLLGYARQAGRLWSALRLSTARGRLASYEAEWRHFLACVRAGTPARPDFADGLAATRAVGRLVRAAAEVMPGAAADDPAAAGGARGRATP
jgi:predicted dehydrogenase